MESTLQSQLVGFMVREKIWRRDFHCRLIFSVDKALPSDMHRLHKSNEPGANREIRQIKHFKHAVFDIGAGGRNGTTAG
jgi:hypothetical protein